MFVATDASQHLGQFTGRDIAEKHAAHLGTAIGTYRGFPAAYVAYFKNTPSGSSREIAGDGISIYYRDGETWKRKRVFKRVGFEPELARLARDVDLQQNRLRLARVLGALVQLGRQFHAVHRVNQLK